MKLLKAFSIFIVFVLMIILGMFIVHTILTKNEKRQMILGEPVIVHKQKMNAYVTGEGKHTIVMLSGLGTASPIADFMPLAEELSKKNKVVILEYFGYGFSDSTQVPRTNENIVSEIREALIALNIQGPYVLMPHSISGIYALDYALTYPDEVEAIIGIDASVPNQTKITPPPQVPKLLGFLNKIGLYRLLDTANTEMNSSGYYSDEALKLAEQAAKWNTMNDTVIDEFEHVLANSSELYDIQFPSDLPVLLFLSSETIKNDETWLPLHEAMFSKIVASDKQKINILEGGHYLHWYQVDVISKETDDFIRNTLD